MYAGNGDMTCIDARSPSWRRHLSLVVASFLVAFFLTTSAAAQTSNDALSTTIDAIKEAKAAGEFDRAVTLATEALKVLGETGEPQLRAQILTSLGTVYIDQHRYDDAELVLLDALDLLESGWASSERGNAQNQLARVFRYRANYAEALAWLRKAEATYQRIEDKSGLADVYNTYGIVYRFLGQLEESLGWHSKGLTLSRELDDKVGMADGLYNTASIHVALSEYREALGYYEAALELDIAEGGPRNLAYSHLRVGSMHIELDDLEQARPHVDRAQTLFKQIETERDYQWAVATMARLEAKAGQIDLARAQLQDVLARSVEASWPVLINRARHWLAELEHWAGNDEVGLVHLNTALDDALSQRSRLRALDLYTLKVEMLESAGRPADALSALRARNELENSVSDALRTSVLAAMQGEAQYERQAIELELAQRERAFSQLALERESSRQRVGIATLVGAFLLCFHVYSRLVNRRQKRRLQEEVADKTSELRERHDELTAAYDAVEQASVTDPLTGLANRRFLERQIEADASQSIRLWTDPDGRTLYTPPSGGDLVFFLVDLDHFKLVNDQRGHAMGDTVLVEASRILEREFRKEDFKVRWGGEEFLVVARFIDRDEAPIIAERVRTAISGHNFAGHNDEPLYCTCSIGFAAYPFSLDRPGTLTWSETLELADQALYSVKHGGRNGWAGYYAPAALNPVRPIVDWVRNALKSGELAERRSSS